MWNLLVTLSLLFSLTTSKLNPDVNLNIIELATKYGYPIETHEVQTQDGYILTLHRIPSKNSTKSPILLMHGLLCSSVDWINLGPGNALGLLLSDDGYDIWMGNQRGTTYSRKHAILNPDLEPERFFNFSFHEMGVYDQPAMIDYILEETEHEEIFYIGHSQGTTAFFIMGSERPEYNTKIRLMTALAPVTYTEHIPNVLLRVAAENYNTIKVLFEDLKIFEFLPHNAFVTDLGSKLCSNGSVLQDLCPFILNIIAGFDDEIDPNFIPMITSNAPAGASTHQILHYLQEIKSGNFCRYDYGTDGNILEYGQNTPPLYDITKITAPISLYYANNDLLNAVEDVLQLAEKLPNLVGTTKVPLDTFNHLDFLWAQHVVELLYNNVISEIKSMN